MNKIRVVLAEDHHLVREAFATLLAEQPDVEVVGQVAEGGTLLEVVERLRPDVLIMDVEMPNHRPVEATRRLRRQNPDVSIVVLSAFAEPEHVVRLFKAGASAYVLKDDTPAMLLQALRAVARGQDWASPRVASILIEAVRTNGKSTTATFSKRELAILALMARGLTNKAIAVELILSPHTVRNYIHRIFRKLGVETRVEAVLFAVSHGLISIEPDNEQHTGN